MSVAAVVLAAGFSRRLGRPKQEVLLQGQSLLGWAVAAAKGAGLAPVLVVLHEGGAIPALEGIHIVLNREAEEGMASSVRAGIAALEGIPGLRGAVLMACDQPLLTSKHLQALCRDEGVVTGSAYRGKIGVPAYFPASAFAALQELQGDVGARALLKHAHSVPDEDLALDIDTEGDHKEAKRLLASRSLG